MDSRFKFCLLTMTGRRHAAAAAAFAFFLHDPAEIPSKQFALTPEEITLLNPNTGTCPVFRTRRDAEITLGIYRRVPVLIKEGDPNGNPWGISFMQGLFNMTSDASYFRTRADLEIDGWTLSGNVFRRGVSRMFPLYQGIMSGPFDHRAADVVKSATAVKRQNQASYLSDLEKNDETRVALPMYWVSERTVADRLGKWSKGWLLSFRDVTSPTNERTLVASVVPRVGIGHKTPLVIGEQNSLLLHAVMSSFVVDFVSRQKIGGTSMTYFFVKQFPVLPPAAFQGLCPWQNQHLEEFIVRRSLELHYTAVDMQPLAAHFGLSDGPFRWSPPRREVMRAEIDAALFHLYDIDREDVNYIMESFPIVRRKDLAMYGEYRTKRLILEVYDTMQRAIDTGTEYQTILDPPPGQGPRHPAKES